MLILAIDPGRDKCGLAILKSDGSIKKRGIYPTVSLHETISKLNEEEALAVVVIGDGTTSEDIQKTVKEQLPSCEIHVIDEKGSTLAGRELWIDEGDHSTLEALLPRFLRKLFAPEALDDFAAVVLGRRHLEKRST